MGLIKLLWDLYYFPRPHEFTPTPDDWPPEGSLHFIECGDVYWKTIPNAYRNYEVSPNEDEYDSRIVGLGIEIMKRFCGSGLVLTKIRSTREFSKKEKFHPERFPVRYRRFLEDMGSSVSIYARDEKTLELLARGFDATAFWANQDINTADDCFFDFYVLPEEPAISSAEDAATMAAAGNYDVWFSLSGWGPCALYITLNPKTVDADALQEIVAAVCEERNILLQNPPQP